VRASLRENPDLYGGTLSSQGEFTESTHLERLALVRNPEVGQLLIEKIFDHEDQELGLTANERERLILAFLTN
jgi:hypothetical protein